ncbi:caspase domain-containing protein [Streptomyces sp. NPDC001594]|uniref:caspase family protein n=1 Tax=Streptomyces sp. NPDC001594 TaxID=3364590 RepID=UPI0036C44786
MNASRRALIIANDDYENPGLKALVSPAEDAVALAAVLSDPKIGEFEVQVARNEPAHTILRKIEDFFADGRPSDELMLHFSCHGLKNESGELFFAASDTVPGRLISTGVAADFVRRCMAASRARSIVLFLDCCYGGAFSKGMRVRAGEDVHALEAFSGQKLGGGRGWAVITASNSMEFALEGGSALSGEFEAPRPSVFTSALVNGLTSGDADLDEDGLVSLDELYEYVYGQVRQENPRQTPCRDINLQGDLYLARSGRKKIKPALLPDDLRAAIASPDIFTRRGALEELRSRMASTHLDVAAGARSALAEMARTEIKWLADEANAALSQVALSPEPSELDFGALPQGSPAPHLEVRLTGPPLARNCEVRPDDNRIRVEETERGLEVSVDTSRAGRLSAGILLKGVGEERTLQVTAEILPERVVVPPPKTPPPPDFPPPETSPPLKTPPLSKAPPKWTQAGTSSKPGAGRPSETPPAAAVGQPGVRDAKAARTLSVVAAIAGTVSVVYSVLGIVTHGYVSDDLSEFQKQGKTFAQAVAGAMPNVNYLGAEALTAALTATAALILAHYARKKAVAAEGNRSGRVLSGVKKSMIVVVSVAFASLIASLVLLVLFLWYASVK